MGQLKMNNIKFDKNSSNNLYDKKVNDDDYNVIEDIPKQSSTVLLSLLISLVLIIILAICIKLTHKNSYVKASSDVCLVFIIYILILSAGSLILRLVSFFAELEHLKTEYNGQLGEVLKEIFNFNAISIIIIIFSCSYITIYQIRYKNLDNYVVCFNASSLLILLAAIIFCQSVGLFGSCPSSMHAFNDLEGVDYGTGMAFSYFYGYLRIILPSNGAENPGIRAKIENYESIHGVKIPVKKLFILIPESGHIPPDLKDASNSWLEGTTSLESEIRDRAGTKRRNYKNTVYKIHPGGEGSNHRPVYIVVEGATPMLTLYDIIQHSHKQTAIYRRNRKKIIAAFYHTLQELLDNSPDCRDVCELVYYKDYTNDKNKVNIGELLINRIKKEAPLCC